MSRLGSDIEEPGWFRDEVVCFSLCFYLVLSFVSRLVSGSESLVFCFVSVVSISVVVRVRGVRGVRVRGVRV